jgi:hypothetical protein
MTGDEGQIKAKREDAARARRWAMTLTVSLDRDRFLAFAARLEAEADALERSMKDALERSMKAPPPPAVTQMQMQVQQGPPAKSDGNEESNTDKS